jgi:hypothetical protein
VFVVSDALCGHNAEVLVVAARQTQDLVAHPGVFPVVAFILSLLFDRWLLELLLDVFELELFVLDECRVREAFLVASVAGLHEVVHVELPNKGGKIVVLEVLGQNLVCKLIRVVNNEPISLMVPVDDCVIRWILSCH